MVGDWGLGLWCLTSLSTIFQLYHGEVHNKYCSISKLLVCEKTIFKDLFNFLLSDPLLDHPHGGSMPSVEIWISYIFCICNFLPGFTVLNDFGWAKISLRFDSQRNVFVVSGWKIYRAKKKYFESQISMWLYTLCYMIYFSKMWYLFFYMPIPYPFALNQMQSPC